MSQFPSYSDFFEKATGFPPLPYQERLATEGETMPSLLDVPTGLGKTAAAVLAWVWRRRIASEPIRSQTPRRLVYSLPMRVLVEQTRGATIDWLRRLGLLADETKEQHPEWSQPEGDAGVHPIAVHLLLGGQSRSDWALWPDRDAILIGTQDMLISRALNRGYAAGRARWPLEFGLLNNDCLWVFDEIQIMDTSLASSLQLDAWRGRLRLRPSRDAFPEENEQHLPRPCRSLWMSATMAKHWLEQAVDWSPRVEFEWEHRHQLTDTERTDRGLRSGQLFQVEKALLKASLDPLEKPKTKDNRADKEDAERKQAAYLKRLADGIANSEDHTASGLTLVIVNTVDRATKLFALLRDQAALNGVPIKLIHSRFRPYEREQWSDFLNKRDDSRRILIATQVVEAGVDLSASVLYTELAPWASLVQRFGRCARYPGESGRAFWLDFDLGSDSKPADHWARPYERSELVAARRRLDALSDIGLESLTAIKQQIEGAGDDEQVAALFPYEPRFVPRDKDLFDLFDTTPDLTGADVDVSRYIRDSEELDVQVFWREMPTDCEPTRKDWPQHRELCPVPFYRFREQLHALRVAGRIWRRSYRRGWERIDNEHTELVYPGQIFLLEKSSGGYSAERGWTGNPHDTEFDLPVPDESTTTQSASADDEDDADDLSQINQWLTVLKHTRDVCQKLEAIHEVEGLTDSEVKVLHWAARWHDRGKGHPAFVAKLKTASLADVDVQNRLHGQPPAKAPESAWRRDKVRRQSVETPEDQSDRRRPGLRHELASALAILETLYSARPAHEVFAWPEGLNRSGFDVEPTDSSATGVADNSLIQELAELSADELDLLVYLVAAHHGKVRMSLRSSPDDDRRDVPDPCPSDKRQARGVRDGDKLPPCQIPSAGLDETGIVAPEVTLSLEVMELGLSPRYGASWRERMQLLLERLGPFRLAYLEALLRAADCRASMEEEHSAKAEPLEPSR